MFKQSVFQKSLLLLSLSVFINLAKAQTERRANYHCWQNFNEGGGKVFANKINVRSAADIGSSIVDSLSIGDSIQIKKVTESFYRQNNIYAPWAQINYSSNSGEKTGFVWLGVVAINSATSSDGVYLFGMESVRNISGKQQEDEETVFNVSLKVLKNKKLVATQPFDINDDESFSFLELKLLGNPKLKNVEEVARLMCSGEACGIPSNYYYYGFTGNNFLELPTKYSVGDADVYYHSESLIFPSENGGKQNQIIKYIEEEELVREATATQKEKRKRTNKKIVYSWDGAKATVMNQKSK